MFCEMAPITQAAMNVNMNPEIAAVTSRSRRLASSKKGSIKAHNRSGASTTTIVMGAATTQRSKKLLSRAAKARQLKAGPSRQKIKIRRFISLAR
jgi:hypothetical protein